VVFDSGDGAPVAGDGNGGVLQHQGDEGKVRGCSFNGRRLGGMTHQDGAETTTVAQTPAAALQSLEADRRQGGER
jgi:hypothetical protein